MNSEKEWLSRLALGTVQFGLDYGISNKTGQVQEAMVRRILTYAQRVGLQTLDTAAAYGTSEAVLGRALKGNSFFDIVSKFPPETSPETLDQLLEQSLKRLAVPTLKAYLAHDFKTFQHAGIREKLEHAKQQGKIEQVGVSVYYPEELAWLLERGIHLDLIQCPFNLFDQRFTAMFPILKQHGVEIHARSSFLQGLFFLPAATLAAHFEPVKGKIQAVQELSQRHGIPLPALLLNFSIAQAEIDKVVFGVQNVQELLQNLAAQPFFVATCELKHELQSFAHADEAILHPGKWP